MFEFYFFDIGPAGPVRVPESSRSYFSQHRVDLLVMSPPWGGPEYSQTKTFDISSQGVVDGNKQLAHAISFTSNVVYILPKNTEVLMLRELVALFSLPCHVYDIMLGNRIKMKVAFIGNIFF